MIGLPRGGAITLESGGIATSGTTARRWSRGEAIQHHLLDSRTGRPAHSRWSEVTVAAGSCVGADVAPKAAFLLSDDGPDWLDEQGLAGRFVTPRRSWRPWAGTGPARNGRAPSGARHLVRRARRRARRVRAPDCVGRDRARAVRTGANAGLAAVRSRGSPPILRHARRDVHRAPRLGASPRRLPAVLGHRPDRSRRTTYRPLATALGVVAAEPCSRPSRSRTAFGSRCPTGSGGGRTSPTSRCGRLRSFTASRPGPRATPAGHAPSISSRQEVSPA